MALQRRTSGKKRALLALCALLAPIGSCAFGAVGMAPAKANYSHPLDPLTTQEYAAAVTVLKQANLVDARSRFPLITLEEPPKDRVLAWKAGDAISRHAFVTVRKDRQVYEGVVDLVAGRVRSWKRVEGVQSGILLTEEWLAAQQFVRRSPEWRDALHKRGIDDLEKVVCQPLTVGYFGAEADEGRRLVKVVCFDSRGTTNFWGRPIGGLIAVVDLDERTVLRVIDEGALPIPESPPPIEQGSAGDLRHPSHPISIIQTQGPSFQLEGHGVVDWQGWRFHVRVDPRLGVVISRVEYGKDPNRRSILYQGSLSELFVPYMDPGVGWYFRTYLDAGEYGVGKLAIELEPGLDCPPNAVFFDAVFADDWGNPYHRERVVCLFERYTGDLAWRHYEAVNGLNEARRRTDLVLRMISAVGNYDYIFDWEFRQDASIRVSVASTGVPQVKAVASPTPAHDESGHDTAFGHMVQRHAVAINHDHFFCFRLDLDVDGPRNGFRIDSLKTARASETSPRRSFWVVETSTPQTEGAAKLRIDLEKPSVWRVVNPNIRGPLGYPVGYRLKPGTNAVSLLAPDDFPQRRAGFTDYHLWVTPYELGERYAAGTYPNQSRGGDGLPRWTRADRPIQNTDLVLWYTLGFHHIVRAEDWPVLPAGRAGFELSPFDFFEHNPALDLPR